MITTTACLRAAALVLALGWLSSCSREPGGPRPLLPPPPPPAPAPPPPPLLRPAFMVSDPLGATVIGSGSGARPVLTANGTDSIVYVSLAPGSVETGSQATVRRVGDSTTVAARLHDGGFDPIPIEAHIGDSIAVVITDDHRSPTGSAFGLVVRGRRPPVVVRTQPPRRKNDVPLNVPIVIVFSEPVDGATLSAGAIKLLRGPAAVPGTVRFLDASFGAGQLSTEFVPATALSAATEYQLVVTSQVRDLDGEFLASPDTVLFTTGQGSTGQPASISLSVSDSILHVVIGKSFQLTATVRDAAGTMLTNHLVTWTTDATVASVSTSGLVTAVAQGAARLTARVDGLSVGLWVRVVAGTLLLRTTTTGIDAPTSYGVDVARQWSCPPECVWGPDPPRPDTFFTMSVNATVAVHLRPEDYSVTIGPVPSNCDPTGYSVLPVRVATGDSATVELTVACDPLGVLAFLTTSGEIYTINSNLTAATRLTDGQSSNFGWAPDGGRIAFTSARDGNSEIYVMNADGSAQTRLTNEPAADEFLSWSPDGGKISFRRDEGAWAYYVMNVDGTNPTSVPNDPEWSRNPALSPDGTKIAVLVERTRCQSQGEGWSGCVTDTDLYARSLDGSGTMRPLGWSNPDSCNGFFWGSGWNITCETRYADPAWSVDGRLIAVRYTECDHSYYGCAWPPSVRLVRADGSGRWTWIGAADDWVQYAWRP